MKNIFIEEREIKRPTIWHALISMLGLIAVMMIGIVAVSAVATALTFIWPRGKEDKNTWKTTMRRGPAPRQYDFGKRGTR